MVAAKTKPIKKSSQMKKFDWLVRMPDYADYMSYSQITETEAIASLRECLDEDEGSILYKKFAKIERKVTETVVKF